MLGITLEVENELKEPVSHFYLYIGDCIRTKLTAEETPGQGAG